MSETRHYATYFDRHYLPKGIALHGSLVRHHSSPFCLWVLCLDDYTHEMLSRLKLEHVRAIPLEELERAQPALAAVRDERLLIEYYWTCGPAFLVHLFRREAAIETLSYLDADLYFFDDPAPLYSELQASSVLIIEHRTVQIADDKPKNGRFNVGMVMFRRTRNGVACLERWRDQCVEWCFDRWEDGRFGDQKYLDEWPALYDDVVIARHRGAGVAPWNAMTEPLRYTGTRVMVGDAPMIFYHAAKVRRINRFLYELHDQKFHRLWMGALLRRRVYAPYVRALAGADRLIRAAGGTLHPSSLPRDPAMADRRRQLSKTDALPFPLKLQRFMLVIGDFAL